MKKMCDSLLEPTLSEAIYFTGVPAINRLYTNRTDLRLRTIPEQVSAYAYFIFLPIFGAGVFAIAFRWLA